MSSQGCLQRVPAAEHAKHETSLYQAPHAPPSAKVLTRSLQWPLRPLSLQALAARVGPRNAKTLFAWRCNGSGRSAVGPPRPPAMRRFFQAPALPCLAPASVPRRPAPRRDSLGAFLRAAASKVFASLPECGFCGTGASFESVCHVFSARANASSICAVLAPVCRLINNTEMQMPTLITKTAVVHKQLFNEAVTFGPQAPTSRSTLPRLADRNRSFQEAMG